MIIMTVYCVIPETESIANLTLRDLQLLARAYRALQCVAELPAAPRVELRSAQNSQHHDQ
jgi:hypothetical protein